ncbi:hypothetical protein AJ62_05983 [Pseudomonas aeruginosa 3575]|nr:hypothetical protein AJ62_05983 [Pseudomonas aeruginosa 3575]
MAAKFAHFGRWPEHALFDSAGAIILERDAYGDGFHRWHPRLLALADEYGFRPRVCRPYRAKAKGKVERFNGYLKGSFITPLAATSRVQACRWMWTLPTHTSGAGSMRLPINGFIAPPV